MSNRVPGIIVALDHDEVAAARRIVRQLGASCLAYKIGITALASCGPGFVRELVEQGKEVFLDLKLHEIPPSVAGAVIAAGKLGASMVTVHASAGSAALRAAVDAARPFPGLAVLALTVVTSLGDADLLEIGVVDSVEAQVLRLARLAASVGCHGVVASPREAAALRAILPPAALIVTPSVRLGHASEGAAARVSTAAEAVRAGATHLVIGRPITAATDPAEAFALALRQVADARGARDPG
jgi:orotidine-5'-phosphate decarboxylase